LIGMAACFLIYFNKQNAGERGKGMTRSAAVIAIPGVAVLSSMPLLALVVMAIALVMIYVYKDSEGARRIRHWGLRASLVLQIATIALLFYNIKTMNNVGSQVGSDQYYQIGYQLMGKNTAGQPNAAGQPVENIVSVGQNFMAQSGDALTLNMRSNPVEMAAL